MQTFQAILTDTTTGILELIRELREPPGYSRTPVFVPRTARRAADAHRATFRESRTGHESTRRGWAMAWLIKQPNLVPPIAVVRGAVSPG